MKDKYKDAFAFAVKIGPSNIFWHFARVVQICDTIEEAEEYLKTFKARRARLY